MTYSDASHHVDGADFHESEVPSEREPESKEDMRI
jgi:hypothetical protein